MEVGHDEQKRTKTTGGLEMRAFGDDHDERLGSSRFRAEFAQKVLPITAWFSTLSVA